MLRLSKKVEYGILAVQYMAKRNGELVSAKEIADSMNLSFDFLSKTLQALMKNGVIISQQGIHGGYKLSQSPDIMTLSHVINAIEERTAIVDCLASPDEILCERSDNCTIKHPIHILQNKIDNIFKSTTISEITPN